MSERKPANLLDDIIARLGAMAPEDRQQIIATAKEATKGMRWVPNPGPQTDAYFSKADVMFIGGSGGGGKTSFICGLALNEHHDIHMFRRESVQLRGIINELTRIVGSTDGFNSQLGVWRLDGGKTIELAGLKDEDDKFDWQGRAGDLKAFDEITHFSKSQFEFIIGWNRSTRDGQRCRVVATGNPPVTPEGLWVIEYWAPWLDDEYPDPAVPGELRWPVRSGDDDDSEIFFKTKEEALAHMATLSSAPRDHRGDIIPPRSRTFIPASLEDNPDLMRTGYAAVLDAMPKELRDAFRDGKFKKSFQDDEWQVIPTEWIVAAQERWTPQRPDGATMTAIGVDVAQGGNDKSTLAPRYGSWFAQLIAKPGAETPNGPAVAGLVVVHMRDGCNINIDLGGGWGGSAFDFLKEQELPVVGINPSSESKARSICGSYGFKNMRAELHWLFREALDPASDEKIALPPDPELKADLAAPRWKLTSSGIQVESKVEIKKRIGRSPDKGDAVLLSWATGSTKARSARIHRLKSRRTDAIVHEPPGGRWARRQ